MTLIAILLIVLSAFLHAGWNLLSKKQHPSPAFFLIASMTGALLLSPTLIIFRDTVLHGISTQVWLLLISAGFFMALYFISLAGAYRAGDMSVAYPLARSSPIIVVSVVTLILGRGDQLSELCIVGIILVVGGCFLIPLQRFSDFRLRNYLTTTCGLALLAAVGTSGYSIMDDEALRLLRTNTNITISNTQLTLLYSCLEALTGSLWLALFVAFRKSERLKLSQMLRINKRYAILAGLAIYLTYTIILISLAFVNNVSYVVGLRQLSIPLGVVLGVFVLKETAHRPKIVGVFVMLVGLILVAIG